MTSMDSSWRAWRLVARPHGAPSRDCLRWDEAPLPTPREGEALVRTRYASVDPTHRIWMSDEPAYMPPIALGDIIRGEALGEVVSSRSSLVAPGDLVTGFWGWQSHVVLGERGLRHKITLAREIPVEAYLGVLGGTGFTAWFGVEDIGQPKPGETMVVSAAAGAVGSIAGQLGKLRGARVIGIAGSEEKCAWLVDACGFDGAINYRRDELGPALDRLCPKGIDVDFENVGGDTLDAVLQRANVGARVALCGLIAGYNGEGPDVGPRPFRAVMMKRLRVQGFIVLDYARRFGEARAALEALVADGKLVHRSHVVEGLERAPDALAGLFTGENRGKTVVRV